MEKAKQHGIKAWQTEGSKYLTSGKALVDANKILLIGHGDFQEFISQADDFRRVLVGGKGLGKSIALIRKAIQLNNHHYATIPAHHPYVVILQEVNFDLKADEYSVFREHNYWAVHWKFLLLLVVIIDLRKETANKAKKTSVLTLQLAQHLGCKQSDADFFNKLEDTFLSYTNNRLDYITPMITMILDRNLSIPTLQNWLHKLIYPHLNIPENEPKTIVMDALDQAFRKYHDKVKGEEREGELSVWEAVQTGLIDAIGEIEDIGKGSLRIYAAIRAEAYKKYGFYGKRSKSQVESFCLELKYNNETLREIFCLNVNLTESKRLAEPDKENREARFFGVSRFSHPYVHGYTETPVDWLIRHSFGSPRELVWHGQRLLTLSKAERYNRAVVSPMVNGTATEILGDYFAEMVPPWDKQVESVFSDIKHAVLTRDQVDAISSKHAARLGQCPIRYMYKYGLVGYNNSGKQRFLSVSEVGNSEIFPDAEYYLIHPCLYNKILETIPAQERAAFISRTIVVGNGLTCPEKIYKPKLVLYWNNDQQEAFVSHTAELNEWTPSISEITQGKIESLTLKPNSEKVTPLFIFSLLAAMSETNRRDPSIHDICAVLERLVEETFIPSVVGTAEKRKGTVAYFRETLAYHIDRPHCLKEASAWIKKTSIKSFDLSIEPIRGQEDIERYMVKGLEPGEISQRHSQMRT